MDRLKPLVPLLIACVLIGFSTNTAGAQSVASGTVEGTVADPSGAVIAGATVSIRNPITGYQQTTKSDSTGLFRFGNLPFNNYHIEVTQEGFAPGHQDVNIRSTVPTPVKITLAVSNITETVSVEAESSDLLEAVPYAHADVDISSLAKLPTLTPGSGLSDAIMLSSPGVVADSNGFFHPLGDHAQTSYSIDGQPINDQQSKAFSTQIPVNAIQSMELVTGTPNAEFGDKTSLVVNATTRSGLGLARPTGGFTTEYGSFGTVSEEANVAVGSSRFGYFLAVNALKSGRFLDTPEFWPVHAIGNNENAFNRVDFIPGSSDALHLNIFIARNWFQIPNTYNQVLQDQRQKVTTFNIAPGYQHTFSPKMLLTINPFVRQDEVSYYPSWDPFNDTPATLAQHRTLTNYGVRGDVSYVNAKHNVKIGGQIMSTRLRENFTLGITDVTFNAPCNDANGNGQATPGVTSPTACAGLGLTPNPNFGPGLLPFDLTRGGSLFQFAASGNVNEYAAYVQDTWTIGSLTLSPGLRVDRYAGLTKDSAGEPRVGLSYLVKSSGTVLRSGYARTMETPYNENLLLSSETGTSGLVDVFGANASSPLRPGRRNQFNTGFEQSFGKFVMVDADYFWKYTKNAYDFDVILNTPITFPISWRKSKLDGFSVRFSTTNIHGFQAYTTMGHTRARFFGPENGGLIFNSPLNFNVFRIDHDQAYQQTTNFRYQWKNKGPWFDFTWRYDNGLVASKIASPADLLILNGAQQGEIDVFCGNVHGTVANPITNCPIAALGATRLRIPAEGTQNDDTNPTRLAPRHILDVGVGTDNLLMRNEGTRITLRFTVSNLTNKIALYNFLSTFSGTHFVTPRNYEGAIGFNF